MQKFPAMVRLNQVKLPEEVRQQFDELPFTFAAEISSTRTDAYYTHMSRSTLKNFAADAARGVAFLDSHDSRKLGFGHSVDGRFEDGQLARVVADFYTVPGIRFGGNHSYQSTDDFIRAVNAGLVRDVSVGFYEGDMRCDICGNSFFDYRACDHWPGETYEEGVATFEITDARLAEVSAVYDGATPGAFIQRAIAHADAGLIEPRTKKLLEVQYRINLPDTKIFQITKQEREDKMEDQLRTMFAPNADIVAEVQELIVENERLRELVELSKQYRAAIVEEALTAGVRAMGDDFPVEAYRTMLENADIENVKEMVKMWNRQAKEKLPQGRQTTETTEVKTEPRIVPDAAFKS